MPRAFIVVAVALLSFSLAKAETITVVGVVAFKPTGARRAGIDVGLYCDDMKNCKLGVQKSSNGNGI